MIQSTGTGTLNTAGLAISSGQLAANALLNDIKDNLGATDEEATAIISANNALMSATITIIRTVARICILKTGLPGT